MKALRILQLTNRIPWPLNDGGNIATYNVTRKLHHFGHKITLASLNTLKHRQNPALIKEVSFVHAVEIDTGLTFLGLFRGLINSFPYNVSRFRSSDFEHLLIRLLKEEDFDLIQLEGSYMAIYLPILRAASKAKIILRSHNIEHQIWARLAAAEPNFLKRTYLKNLSPKIERFEKDTLQGFDGIVAITDQDRYWYERQGYKGQIVTINAGVDLEKFQVSEDSPIPNTVCFLGSLEWQPNVQGLKWFLEEVWNVIHDRHPKAELHVAGKHPPPEMERWAVPGMHFHGMVPDAVEFLNRYRIFIVPLLSGGGMRLKIVEAMALGKCIISTEIGAEGIDCEHGEEIWKVESPDAFRQRLDQMLSHPDQAEAMGQKAKLLARQKFGWEALVRKFEDFYSALI